MKPEIKNKFLSAINIGIILNWLSLFLSYKKLPNTDLNSHVATGGFPFKAFKYPHPPMGNDLPPIDQLPLFFLNLSIWVIIGLVVFLLLRKKIKDPEIFKPLGIFAIFFTVLGLIYFMIKFD